MPLMPKATAVWLVDNTSLTFEQIADFCGLHPLEVQGIADGEVAIGIVGLDPIANGQLTAEEIERCEGDPKAASEAAPSRPARCRCRAPRARATRRSPSARTSPTRSPGWCATIPELTRRADLAS